MAFRVIRSLAEVPEDFGPCSLTIGNFDGIHAGHLYGHSERDNDMSGHC